MMVAANCIVIYDHQGKPIGTRRLSAVERRSIPELPRIEFPQQDGWSEPLDGGLWYIVRTVPQWERRVRNRLIESKHSAYVPEIEVRMNGPRNLKRWVTRPMMPGYVFLKGDQAHRFEEVREERGVIDFMRVTLQREGFYVTLPHRVILGIEQTVLKERQQLSKGTRNTKFRRKDRVVIVEGAFGGLQAIVDKIDKAGGITLLVELFGRLVPAKVEADEIRAA